jgi:hypothetical protein
MGCRFSAMQLSPRLSQALHTTDAVRDMRWQPYDPPLIANGAADRLFDPPAGICPKAASPPPIESIHCLHEPEVPLLDQVQQRQAPPGKLFGDTHHEAQIGTNHVCASLLSVEAVNPQRALRLRCLLGVLVLGRSMAGRMLACPPSALLDSLGQSDFLQRCQASITSHFGKVAAHQVCIARDRCLTCLGFVL